MTSIRCISSTPAPEKQILRVVRERFTLGSRELWQGRLTYLDTFDWRLFRNNWMLRAETSADEKALSLADLDGRPFQSAVVQNIPGFARDLGEGPFGTVLERLSGIRRLLPLAHVDLARNSYRILGAGQKTIAWIRFWKGKIVRPRTQKSARRSFNLWEVECLKGYEAESGSLLEELSQRNGTAQMSELRYVLEALGRQPLDYTSRLDIQLDPAAPAGEAVHEILEVLFRTIVANEDGVRQELDSEFLHEYRVAVRRTRSALTQIKGIFSEEQTGTFKQEFAWLGKVTGPSRDLDVYLLQMDSYESSLPEEVRSDLTPLRDFLESQQEKRHRILVEALDSPRYQKLRTEWEVFLQGLSGAAKGEATALPIQELASRRIWRVLSRILKQGKRIQDDTPAEALHRLRIECKKLRYLLEFFKCLYPPEEVRHIIRTLRRLQDNLGDFNDCQVQRAKLKEFARLMVAEGEAVAETLMAMGRLVGRLEEKEQKVRARFSEQFEAFSSPGNKRVFRRIFKASQSAGDKV